MSGTQISHDLWLSTHIHVAECFVHFLRTFFFTCTSKTSLSDVTCSAAIVVVTVTAPRQLGAHLDRCTRYRDSAGLNKPRDYPAQLNEFRIPEGLTLSPWQQ